MTSDKILSVDPGPELDELIGKLMGAAPRIKYYAMNREETAYYIDFDLRSLAEEWHKDKVERFPNGSYVRDGGHIVRKEIYRRYSEDIASAWDVIKKANEKGWQVLVQIGNDAGVEFFRYDSPYRFVELEGCTPDVICRAALMAMENKECS